MGCKHCSFKSYCIQPWIPSITSCKMVTKKRRKKIPLPPSRLALQAAAQQDRQQRAHPPGPPSSDLPAGTHPPRTDLGPQASPTPGGQGQGRGLPRCTGPAAQSAGIRWPSFRPGWGRRLPQPRALPHLPGPPWPALPLGLAPGRWTAPPWPLLTPRRHGSAARAQAGRAEERPRGRGGSSPDTHRRAHTRPPARPWEGGSRRGHASRELDTWPRRTQWPRASAAGRGDADSGRPALGGARSGLPSPAPGSSAGRSAATPGGAFVPEGRGACSRGLRHPPPPGF